MALHEAAGAYTAQGRWDELHQYILDPAVTMWSKDELSHKAFFEIVVFVLMVLRTVREEDGKLPPVNRQFTDKFAEWLSDLTYPAYRSNRMLLLATHLLLNKEMSIGCRALDAEILQTFSFQELAYDLISKETNVVVSAQLNTLVQIFQNTISIDAMANMVREAGAVYNNYALYTLLNLGPHFAGDLMMPTERVFVSDSVNNMNTNTLMISVKEFGFLSVSEALGPANNYMHPSQYNRCTEFGCRMLTCLCRGKPWRGDEDDLELDTMTEGYTMPWFTGACDFCMTRIPNACWAVRRPIVGGGWLGCYCSYTCVVDDKYSDEVTEVDKILILKLKQRTRVVDRINDFEAVMAYKSFDTI